MLGGHKIFIKEPWLKTSVLDGIQIVGLKQRILLKDKLLLNN